jgi:hypothetical protein
MIRKILEIHEQIKNIANGGILDYHKNLLYLPATGD